MIIRPGDVLVFGPGVQVSPEQAERLKATWREKLPGLKDVVIISGTAALAVYREEESE